MAPPKMRPPKGLRQPRSYFAHKCDSILYSNFPRRCHFRSQTRIQDPVPTKMQETARPPDRLRESLS